MLHVGTGRADDRRGDPVVDALCRIFKDGDRHGSCIQPLFQVLDAPQLMSSRLSATPPLGPCVGRTR
jgi:hypothetical protein